MPKTPTGSLVADALAVTESVGQWPSRAARASARAASTWWAPAARPGFSRQAERMASSMRTPSAAEAEDRETGTRRRKAATIRMGGTGSKSQEPPGRVRDHREFPPRGYPQPPLTAAFDLSFTRFV